MAGEIMTAYVAVLPSMKGFGAEAARQIGPQATAVGARAGRQAGAAFSAEASKGSQSWLASTAQGAIKNVTLYGSMYAIITKTGQGISAMLDAMIGFNAQIEQSTIGFETLLGSSDAAGEQMQWIKDFAKETPFQYGDLVGYSQQLLALGFNAEMSKEVLEATGDAAAALGRGSESIQRINLALGQMWTKGKVQSQEMLQLTEAGIGAWQILADAYGTSVEQIQEAVTDGIVKASDAVPALLDGMNARFGGLMEKQSQTYQGMLSNIQDTLQQQLAEAGEPLFQVLTVEAKKFLDALDDPEVVKMMTQLGQALADGAEFIAKAGMVAWEYRDAILAVGIAYTAMSVAQNLAAKSAAVGGTSGAFGNLLGGSVGTWKAASTAAATARVQMASAEAAAVAAQAAHAKAGIAYARTTPAMAAANTEVKASIYNYDRWTIATQRLAVAQAEQFSAQRALTASAPARIAAERAQQEAIGASIAAEMELKAARSTALKAGGMSALKTAGPIIGLLGMVDAYGRVGDAARDGDNAALGFAESVGSGALAGAALGSVIPGLGTAAGAAIGAVGGLAVSVWSYQTALNAANKDTTLAQQALQNYGVEANLAALALAGVTNAQLEAAGGVDAVINAMKSGKFDEFMAGLEEKADSLRQKYADADKAAKDYLQGPDGSDPGGYAKLSEAMFAAKEESEQLDRTLASLRGNIDSFAVANDQMVASNYEAAFAADMQTGSLGSMTKAAWDAVVAQGGLSGEVLNAAVRMEGLAGIAGYATQMISGIPTGTQINFSTNAAEIANKIASLYALSASYNNMAGGASIQSSIQDQIRRYQQQIAGALTAPVSTIPLPTLGGSKKSGGGGGSSAASKAAQSAAQAAAEAARRLEQDRKAQVAFGDAFGTLMESALEGNFEEYRKKLEDEITSLTRDGYGAAADTLKRMSTALNTAALDYSALTAKLNVASDAYDELTGKMREQYETSRDLILGLGKATDAQSFDQLAYLLGETTSKALEYQTVLAQLKNQGLSADLWNQLAQAGPESMALAQSILDQGQSGIDQLNGLSDGLANAAESMGTLTSEQMYQNGVNDMQAYIDGLKSQSAALEAQLQTIANTVLNKTAGAITPGNAGYSQVSAAPTQVTYQFGDITFDASKMSDLNYIQDFIAMLNQAATSQLVNQAGTVTS